MQVNNYLNRFMEGTMLHMVANELQIIATAFPIDGFTPFLNCLSTTKTSKISSAPLVCASLCLTMTHDDAWSNEMWVINQYQLEQLSINSFVSVNSQILITGT